MVLVEREIFQCSIIFNVVAPEPSTHGRSSREGMRGVLVDEALESGKRGASVRQCHAIGHSSRYKAGLHMK